MKHRTLGRSVLSVLIALAPVALSEQAQGQPGIGPPVVTAPGLGWATYYGGADMEVAEAMTLAPDGTVVIAGFIQVNDPFNIDAFVARFSPDGTELLGEAVLDGGFIDGAFGVAVDPQGIVTVVGQTWSGAFPTTPGAFQETYGGGLGDGFLVQLSPDLSEILYATYLGGSGEEAITGLAVDQAGGFVVCGYTGSEDLPVTPGAFQAGFGGGWTDAFVARLVPSNEGSAQLTYATYLGGSGDDAEFDPADPFGPSLDQRLLRQAVAVTPEGNVVVLGMTWSTDFPVSPGAWQTAHSAFTGTYYDDADLYLTVLNPRAAGPRQLVYSTLIGGPGRDAAEGVVARDSALVSLVGLSQSPEFPVTANAYQSSLKGFQDAVVMQVLTLPQIPRARQILYSTYFGGETGGEAGYEGRDAGNGLYQMVTGDLVVAGLTTATDYPTTDGTVHQGFTDMFVFRLDPTRKPAEQLVYSTLFGGSASEDICVGPVGNGSGQVFISGDTRSEDLPGVEGSYDETHAGGVYDALLARISVGGLGR